jgi:hypothetical protein
VTLKLAPSLPRHPQNTTTCLQGGFEMRRIVLSLTSFSLILSISVHSESKGKSAPAAKGTGKKVLALWRQPSDIRTRNLFYGAGGQAGQPKAPFHFIEEDRGGTNPKFIVTDARGVRWKVKLGEEARPETAANRLLWAAGYFTDVDYYLPQFHVAGLQKLSRGMKYVSVDGTIHGGRFERSHKKIGDWSWFENPFIGTREFNGLRVMMALINNWDLKKENNAIYNVNDSELRYVVSDLGGTFGKTGGSWTRSKGDVDDYVDSRFIHKATARDVDLVIHDRPPALYAVAVPYYVKRTEMEKVAEDIPRGHAKWIGHQLCQLSNNQIKDIFRAAGYSPAEVEGYSRKLRGRINQLTAL